MLTEVLHELKHFAKICIHRRTSINILLVTMYFKEVKMLRNIHSSDCIHRVYILFKKAFFYFNEDMGLLKLFYFVTTTLTGMSSEKETLLCYVYIL